MVLFVGDVHELHDVTNVSLNHVETVLLVDQES